MLFLLYVNDLTEVVKASNVASFADDIKTYKSIESISDAVPLQADLCSLTDAQSGEDVWYVSSFPFPCHSQFILIITHFSFPL